MERRVDAVEPRGDQQNNKIKERLASLEAGFWHLRYVALIAVGVAMMISVFWFFYIFVDLYHLVEYVLGSSDDLHEFRAKALFLTVETIDSTLMALIFLVFSYGIYELFVSRIDRGMDDDDKLIRGKILEIRDLANLEGKLARLIIMILIVKIFYYGLSLKMDVDGKELLEHLLMLGGVVLIIALSLFLSHSRISVDILKRSKEEPPGREE